jgi:hypothetical protein
MAGFFTKLDAGITDSTIWHQPDHTRLTWITMLAMADQHGYVGASIPGLASRARVPIESCVAALECFKAPDEYSRTKDHDGRRIAEAEGGWVLLNHAKYRAAQSKEDRRERSRLAMAALRARRKAEQTTGVNGDQTLTKLPQAEAEAEATKLEATPLVVLPSAKRLPACPTDEIVSMYHAKLPMLPRVEVMNDGRKRSLSARWKQILAEPEFAKNEDPRSEGLGWFAWYFDHAAKSPFLTGKAKNWRADFDFLINPQKFVKVVEGHYHKEQA